MKQATAATLLLLSLLAGNGAKMVASVSVPSIPATTTSQTI